MLNFFRFTRIGFHNDIAILVLSSFVPKSMYVMPICLPISKNKITTDTFSGKWATVAGWGTTFYGGKESSMTRYAEIPVWRNEDCDHVYFQLINNNFICAGYSDGGVDACQVKL